MRSHVENGGGVDLGGVPVNSVVQSPKRKIQINCILYKIKIYKFTLNIF